MMKKLTLSLLLALTAAIQPCYADFAGAATAVGDELEKQAGEDPVKGLIWWIANTFGPNVPTEVAEARADDCDEDCIDQAVKTIIAARPVNQCATVIDGENLYGFGTAVGNPGTAPVGVTIGVWDDTDIVHYENQIIPAKGFLKLDLSNVQVSSYALIVVTGQTPQGLSAFAKYTNIDGEFHSPMDCQQIMQL